MSEEFTLPVVGEQATTAKDRRLLRFCNQHGLYYGDNCERCRSTAVQRREEK